MLFNSLVGQPEPRKQWPLLLKQMYSIGVQSLLIIMVSGLFIDMVLGLQGYIVLTTYNAEASLGMMVALSLLQELGPVVTALLFAGCAGSAVSAEIGLTKATEQISSLEMMTVDPLRRIVAPRFWACLISLPLLAIIFVALGILGGAIVGVNWKGIDSGFFWLAMQGTVEWKKICSTACLKAEYSPLLSLGLLSSTDMTLYRPLRGLARQRPVPWVHSSLAVLGLDFMLTALMFGN